MGARTLFGAALLGLAAAGGAAADDSAEDESKVAKQSQCHPSYVGRCVPVGVDDVDCDGGSGNGPYYVRGPLTVSGPDVYGLDQDHDGRACEPYKPRTPLSESLTADRQPSRMAIVPGRS